MTINEIAEMAGVSRATVSRYLNDGYVSEEKREKIRAVIEKTGYCPSVQAQNLRSKRTKQIGVIIPKINSASISRIVAGISQVLSEAGYQLLLANTFNDEKEELKYLKLFKENHVDGIILNGTIMTKEHERVIGELRVPVVVLGQQTKLCSCVYHDDYFAAKEMTELLLRNMDQGGKLLHLGVTRQDHAVGEERTRGFTDAVKESGFPETSVVSATVGFSIESGYQGMKEMMECEKDIRGVFCSTDSIAVGAMMCLKDLGYRIPEDVRLAGIGDSTIGHIIEPKLATAHYFYKTSGIEAANLLIDILDHGKTVKREIKMGYQILPNKSI
ncbi:MAG: LacI family DNA-binding transcriptional regulator [Lachnospiraceae bacterium]